MYIRVQELNGWEHEEWFKYYPIHDAKRELPLWEKLGEQFNARNKDVAKARWEALQKEEEKDRRDTRRTVLYAQFGVPRPAPNVTDAGLTEYHVDIKQSFSEADIKRLNTSSIDLEDYDTDDDERKHVQESWTAYRKGDDAYRVYFYNMNKPSSYMSKHSVKKHIDVATLETLALKQVDPGHYFYKT